MIRGLAYVLALDAAPLTNPTAPRVLAPPEWPRVYVGCDPALDVGTIGVYSISIDGVLVSYEAREEDSPEVIRDALQAALRRHEIAVELNVYDGMPSAQPV